MVLYFLRLRVVEGPVLVHCGGLVAPPRRRRRHVDHVEVALLPSPAVVCHVVHLDVVELQRGRGRRRRPRVPQPLLELRWRGRRGGEESGAGAGEFGGRAAARTAVSAVEPAQ